MITQARPVDEYVIQRATELSNKNFSLPEIAKDLGISKLVLRTTLQRHKIVLQPAFNVQQFVQACLNTLQTMEEMAAQHELPIEEVERLVAKYDLPYLCEPRPIPSHGTHELPGSKGKIEELRRRAEANEELWHPDDVDFYGCREDVGCKILRETRLTKV